MYGEDSISILVENHVRRFVSRLDSTRSFERTLMTSATDNRSVPAFNKTELFNITQRTVDLHSSLRRVTLHPAALQTTDFDRALTTVNTLCRLVGEKREKNLIIAGLQIARETPAYLTSYHFSEEHFGIMCMQRSAVDPSLMRRWRRMSELVESILRRLHLLLVTLDCFEELIMYASEHTDVESARTSIRAGNLRVIRRVQTHRE